MSKKEYNNIHNEYKLNDCIIQIRTNQIFRIVDIIRTKQNNSIYTAQYLYGYNTLVFDDKTIKEGIYFKYLGPLTGTARILYGK